MDTETNKQARAAVTVHLARLVRQGVAASGQVRSSGGDHSAAGRALARHADDVHARTVTVGRSPRGPSPSSPTAASPPHSPTAPPAPSCSSTPAHPPAP
ncbi:hypothetical protein ACIPWE_20560 [Streptomyces sp. NPDC090073]|uniref:hypothetical protein n=1 Tax=Streptomyces sp. NPDC090073 TaxID=3365936 RepID=UPI00380BA3B4